MDHNKMDGDTKGIILGILAFFTGLALLLGVGMHFGNQSQQAFDKESTKRVVACLAEKNSPTECKQVRGGNRQ